MLERGKKMQISQKIGQYEVLKTYGKDAAIVTDTMFETTDSYIMTVSEQLDLLGIKNYDLIGFPSLINQFQWENKACFIYKEFEGARLDTIPYDIDFAVNAIKNLCLSIYQVWTLSNGYFYPEIDMNQLYFTKDQNLVFKNAYNFSMYKKCDEGFITKQLSYVLYQLVTGRKQLDDIRSIDPSFSYILNSTILKCAKGETVLGIKAFATTLQQYKETDLIVYQQDRSLRPPRRKKNTLTRFMPNPEQLEFYKIKQDINRENMENTAEILSKPIVSEENRQKLEINDSKQKQGKEETLENHITEHEEEMLLPEEELLAIKTKKTLATDEVEGKKKRNLQEESLTKVASKQQKEAEDKKDLKIEKSEGQRISSKKPKEKINSQKSIKSLESEKKEQNIKPKSKTESQSGKIEKIGKEKDHNKKIIPQDELKEKETHPKSHIPKLRSQKSKVLNKQEEKRIQNISSAGKGSWNNIKLPKANNDKTEKKEVKVLNDKESLNLKQNKENDSKKENSSSKKEIEKHNKILNHQKINNQKENHENLRQKTNTIQETEIVKEPNHDEKLSDIPASIIAEENGEDIKNASVSNNEIILENKKEMPIESSSIKKAIQEKENIIYESEIKDFVEQNSSIPDIKKEATIPIKTEYKVKKERKFIMPKINIPMSVCIALISSVLLVIGVGGFFIHNIHQKNKYNDIIEVVDRSTNQKEKIKMLHQAIDILPKESKAYEKLLDVYLEDAVFSSKEESAYLKTIHQNWDKVKKGDGYGNLSYEIGKAYWYYYEYDDMNNEEITRMKSAVQWFEDSLKYKSTAKHHRIAKIYCEIGKFNQEITLNVKEGTDKGVYKKYYNNLKDLLEIGNSNTVASLELYKLTVNSIDTYRERFIDDGINEEEINQTKQDVLYKVNETSVVTEKEKELKNTILYSSKQ